MSKSRLKLLIAATATSALMAITVFLAAAPAPAAPFQVDSGTEQAMVKVNPGELTFDLFGPAAATLGDVTLTGSPVTTFGGLGSMRVIDARGEDIGWRLHLVAPDFTHDTSATIPPIPTNGKFRVFWHGYWNGAGSGGVTATNGNLGGTGFDILDTGDGEPHGRGTSWANPVVSLEVPADAYAGSYTTTVTATLYSY